MKKNILIIIFGLILINPFTSCESFLEKNPQGELTQNSFPVSESDALLATNAAYATMRN
jgi:hypothetical protein